MMPGMDNHEVVREIRHANVDTPVLMLTARGSVSDKIARLDHGADDYMTKPFSPAELMAHLRALMRRQGSVIIEKIWGVESNAADNNVEAYVSFPRKKLRYLESNARIETIRKVGCKFAE